MVIVLFTAILFALPVFTHSEEPQNTLSEAQSLRDAGSFGAAAELLRLELAKRPDDGDAARLLGQTLYWMKDISGARAVYENALDRHPEDSTLQLQYARMLVETADVARARELLIPLLKIPTARAEAEEILGTLAYWKGDLTGARRHFLSALDANPKQEKAQQQLREILITTAPWLRISSNLWRDDQPFHRAGFGVEAGWFVTPLTEVTARARSMQYRLHGTSRTVGLGEVAMAHYTPSIRVDTELAAGGVRRSQAGRPWDWTGRAGLGVQLPVHLSLRGRIERATYLSTASSLETPVMARVLTGLLHLGEVRGWLGEASYQHQHYADGNAIRTASGWLLAPLLYRQALVIQAGYAAGTSNANESRFVLSHPNQSYAPDDPRFDTAGNYAPYYTPSHLRTQSAIVALKVAPTRDAAFHIRGSYAVRAPDEAPFFYGSAGQAIRDTYSRKFSPWDVHTSLQLALGEHLTLEPTAGIGRSAFYSWATAGFQVTHRFTGSTSPHPHAP
jgi:hypothetical protein